MSFTNAEYFYNEQLKSYLLQFMAIFSGLNVMTGKTATRDEQLISVPIHYAAPDRVVAAILADNTQNKPLRLPMMSAYISGLEKGTRMSGVGVERRTTFVPVGGLIPDDVKVIHQRKGMPYDLQLQLFIYVSNTSQQFQILEQILPLFDPQLVIQVSDGLFDMAKITSVELQSIQIDNPFPIGTDKRIIQSTLTFTMPVFIDIPAQVRNNFIERIKIRIGTVDSTTADSDIVDELNGQGLLYETVSIDDIGFR